MHSGLASRTSLHMIECQNDMLQLGLWNVSDINQAMNESINQYISQYFN